MASPRRWRASTGAALAAALHDLDVVRSEVVRLPRAQPGYLFGSGKIEELKTRMTAAEVDATYTARRGGRT